MGKTVAYIRTSTDKQDLNNQKLEVLEFARKKDLKVDEFVEITISSRKTTKQRRIDDLMQKLVGSDTLIVTELSRLGRSTAEVISLINELIGRNIRVIAIKQNLDILKQDMNSKIIITLFSLFAELEKDMISLRTKEALSAKKAQGIKLGKPKGTIQKSKGTCSLKLKESSVYIQHENIKGKCNNSGENGVSQIAWENEGRYMRKTASRTYLG